MRILYFARLRQIIGRGQDEIEIPTNVKTISALIEFLKSKDERVAEAFGDLRGLKVAINQKHATLDAPLQGATEIAFFPPVTGG
jgi:sulfur-carrier protein